MGTERARTFSGAKLRDLRRNLGMSREALAFEVDRSYLSIRNYESGQTIPPEAVAERLADALRVPLVALCDEAPDAC